MATDIQSFEHALRIWLTDNGYIGEGWRMRVISKVVLGKTDCAEVLCEAFKPRARKPFYLSFKYNFVRKGILINTIDVVDA